jgi:hypothetical protein
LPPPQLYLGFGIWMEQREDVTMNKTKKAKVWGSLEKPFKDPHLGLDDLPGCKDATMPGWLGQVNADFSLDKPVKILVQVIDVLEAGSQDEQKVVLSDGQTMLKGIITDSAWASSPVSPKLVLQPGFVLLLQGMLTPMVEPDFKTAVKPQAVLDASTVALYVTKFSRGQPKDCGRVKDKKKRAEFKIPTTPKKQRGPQSKDGTPQSAGGEADAWSRDEEEELLDYMEEHYEHYMVKSKKQVQTFWEELVQHLLSKSMERGVDACKQKWQRIKAQYKALKDEETPTGGERRAKCWFYNQVNRFVGVRLETSEAHVEDSMGGQPGEASEQEQDEEERSDHDGDDDDDESEGEGEETEAEEDGTTPDEQKKKKKNGDYGHKSNQKRQRLTDSQKRRNEDTKFRKAARKALEDLGRNRQPPPLPPQLQQGLCSVSNTMQQVAFMMALNMHAAHPDRFPPGFIEG